MHAVTVASLGAPQGIVGASEELGQGAGGSKAHTFQDALIRNPTQVFRVNGYAETTFMGMSLQATDPR